MNCLSEILKNKAKTEKKHIYWQGVMWDASILKTYWGHWDTERHNFMNAHIWLPLVVAQGMSRLLPRPTNGKQKQTKK